MDGTRQSKILYFALYLWCITSGNIQTKTSATESWKRLYYYRDGDEIHYDDLEVVIRHAIDDAKPGTENMRTLKHD
jgi:hypothetical protein